MGRRVARKLAKDAVVWGDINDDVSENALLGVEYEQHS